jgi:lipopolysaccharide export system protein LptA
LTALTVVMDRQNHLAEAVGDVRATLNSAPSAVSQPPLSKPLAATHVLASSAHFDDQAKTALFRGTDAQPARLWQDASQVLAANLLFNGENHTFSARPASAGGAIHAVFAGTPTTRPANKTDAKPGSTLETTNVVRVTSPAMDYNDVQRVATFSGGVTMDGTLGQMRSKRAMAYLTPAQPGDAKRTAQPTPTNGSLERVVVLGDVQIEQPGRHGTGEQLVYTAATGSSVLTGTADRRPVVVDAQQGSVTGTTLTFGAAGSTIVVAGEPVSAGAKHARVRTETEVRQ